MDSLSVTHMSADPETVDGWSEKAKRERPGLQAGVSSERELPVRRPLNASLQLLILLNCWSMRHLGAKRPPGHSLQYSNNTGIQEPTQP